MKIFKGKKIKNAIRRIKKIFLWCFVIVAVLLAKLFFWDVPSLRSVNPTSTCYMQQHKGRIMHKWVPYSRMAPSLARAVIAAEDSRFYEHQGVDLEEFKNAFHHDVKRGHFARGGSTITMQLAKNLYLSPHKNLIRKAFEILLAFKIDFDVPKNRILEIYLNMVEWGNGIYGAQAAAEYYFKKSALELSPSESAFLAAILPNPKKWGVQPMRPYIRSRVSVILSRMNGIALEKETATPPEVTPKSKVTTKPQVTEIPKVVKMPPVTSPSAIKAEVSTPTVLPQNDPVPAKTIAEEAPQKTIFLDE